VKLRPPLSISLRVPGLLVAGALALFLWACGSGEEPYRVDWSRKETIGYEGESRRRGGVTYAYLPQYSHQTSYLRHHDLVEYLRNETGLDVRQIFPDTFDEHMKMVGQGKIDISFSNPFIYIKLAHRFGARAFARVVEIYGRENFRGQIVCRKDNEAIRSLEDCRGKRWIAVDPSSAGGYLYPLGTFLDHGLRKEDFAEIAFSPGPGGKQEKVVLAVYAGRYEVGSIREGTLDVASDKVDVSRIRVLAHTPWYPGWVYAARQGLEPRVVEAVKDALLKLDCRSPAHAPLCEAARFTGVIASSDADYDPVRRLASQLKMDLEP